MSLTSAIVDSILTLGGAPAYALVGGLVFAEAAILLGFVIPGETAVLLGGVLAGAGTVSLPAMAAVVVLAAVLGDSVGYEVGKKWGRPLLGLRAVRPHGARLTQALDLVRRNAGRTVFVGRFTAFLRATVPGLAGMSGVPYRRFVAFNALGAVVWGIGFTMLGYAAGDAYTQIETYVGDIGDLALGIVALVLLVWGVRRWRRRHVAGAAAEPAATTVT